MENNIHILPTDKPSRLYLNTKEYIFDNEYSLSTDECQNKYIYITNNEEIKERDWYLDTVANVLFKNDKIFLNGLGYKKIILTTDQDLIKDGVQAIDDEFLEWFVKNPSCKVVEVEKAPYDGTKSIDKYWGGEYKIIIPKEEVLLQSSIDGEPIWGEAKKDINTCKNFDRETGCDLVDCPCEKQETLEEKLDKIVSKEPSKFWEESDKRMEAKAKLFRYSEEEVIKLLQKALTHKDDGEIGSLVTAQGQIRTANFYSWFEKFKNK